MSTKTSTAQPPGRRTPLSLNTTAKQMNKPTNNKNDNNKKETNSYNQKTDNSKKDTQQEKKNFVEKKNSSTDTRKSSTESKKVDEVKITTAAASEESKKGQNGVSTNGVKDKDKVNANEGTKSKPETSSGVSTPKKESQKAANEGAKSKPESSSAVMSTSKKETQKAAAEKKEDSAAAVVVKEIKKDENKNKEKIDENVQKSEENKKEKERKEDIVKEVVEKKKSDENISDAKKTEIAKSPEKVGKDIKEANNFDCSESKKESALTEQKADKIESKIEGRSKVDEKSEAEQTEDVEMAEALMFDAELPAQIIAASTPAKPQQRSDDFVRRNEAKISPKSEAKPSSAPLLHTPDRKNCPRSFSSISGRRSIRPIGDYSFSGNLQIRESYRKINTELDFTSSSLNVTVGSEVPNNDSFSFFSRSRKRDRSSPSRPSAMEVQGDISPKSPKRARIDIGMAGFFSAMASPITMLRSRLSRATVQSTPKKQMETPVDDDVVENVSGISVNEELTTTEDLTMNPDSTVDNAAIENDQQNYDDPIVSPEKPAVEGVKQEDDLRIQETAVIAVDSQAKKKCSIM